jgi:hypothetical protein
VIGDRLADRGVALLATFSPAPVLVGGLVIEVIGTASLLLDLAPGFRLPVFFALHAAGSLGCAFALLRWMPRLLRRRAASGYLFFAAMCFFIPVLGALALFGGLVVPTLLPHKHKVETPLVSTEIPDLPYRPLIVGSQPIYGAMGLVGVIRHANDAAIRVRAVMATRQLSDQYAIPILQVALRDPVDDVRLLAYALLDGKERAIYANIKTQTARLGDAPKSTHGSVHKRLAQEYWELVYLGLAQGEVLAHVLTSGLKHAQEALEALPNDAGLHFLLGRMLGAQNKPPEAAAAYDRAEALGLPKRALLSYRAELAFRTRRFEEIPELLRELPPESKKRMPMAAVVDYWGAR